MSEDGGLSELLRAVAKTPEKAPRLEGRRVGRYVLSTRIGVGGMGEVWRARDERLDRDVAIKLLLLEDDAEHRARFLREARASAALSHPNLCAIYDVDEDDGVPFIAMELLEGESLRAHMTRGLPQDRARELALELARGLAHAHAAGIVHRDVKPENVHVTRDGHVKLLDFGLARQAMVEGAPTSTTGALSGTMTGAVLGTPRYMSPEQAEGKRAAFASDVFSFGVVLHEMLGRGWPWDVSSPAAVSAAILRDPPRPLPRDVDPALGAVALRCLEKEPTRRYASAREMLAALEATATPPRRARTRQLLAFLGGAALAAAAAVMVVAAPEPPPVAPPAPRPAQRLERLTDAPGVEAHPALSPDGKFVVYSAKRGADDAEIFLLRVGGERAVQLTDDDKVDDQPAFSPDGTQIAWQHAGAVWLMGATGESKRKLVDVGYLPQWSPDGTQVYFSTEDYDDAYTRGSDSQVHAVDVATGEVRVVVAGVDAIEPAVSSTGHLAFWSNRLEPRSQRDLMIVPSTGGAPRFLTDDASLDFAPAWSDDGTRLYFLSSRGGERNLWELAMGEDGRALGPPSALMLSPTELITLDAAGSKLVFAARADESTMTTYDVAGMKLENPRVVLNETRLVVGGEVANDGSVVFGSWEEREDVIWISADGRERRRLTNDIARDRAPRFIAGANRVVMQALREGQWGIWSVSIEGSKLEPLFAPGFNPIASPDGKAILAINDYEKAAVLRRFDLETRTSTDVAVPSPLRPLVVWGWLESVIGVDLLDGGAPMSHLFHLDTGALVRVSLPPGTAAACFFGDARHVLYVRKDEVRVLDVESGEDVLLQRTPDVFWATTSPDAQRLLLVQSRREQNLWMLELGP